MSPKITYCRQCRQHWREVVWDDSTYRRASNSQKRRKRSKSKSKSQQREDKQDVKGKKDPLRPFAFQAAATSGATASSSTAVKASTTPWTNTTPTRALPPVLEEMEETKEEIEEESLDIDTAMEHVAALQKLMGNALPTELIKTLEKSVEHAGKEEAKLTPQLIFKVTKCQKAVDKAQGHLAALDSEWEIFQKSMKERILEQKKGYISNRAAAQVSYMERLVALKEAQEELKQKAAGATLPPDVALLSDAQFADLAKDTGLEDEMTIDLSKEVDEDVKQKVASAMAPFRAPKRKNESPEPEKAKDAKTA